MTINAGDRFKHRAVIAVHRARVAAWHRLYEWVGQRQDRAYDRLVDTETGKR